MEVRSVHQRSPDMESRSDPNTSATQMKRTVSVGGIGKECKFLLLLHMRTMMATTFSNPKRRSHDKIVQVPFRAC